MIVRSMVAVGVLLTGLGIAPIQCGHEPDPNLRREDTPGDALWDLAARFREAHDDAAADTTLRYLVEKYPANRHSAAARAELDAGPASIATGGDAAK
jgi:hypothetical protein